MEKSAFAGKYILMEPPEFDPLGIHRPWRMGDSPHPGPATSLEEPNARPLRLHHPLVFWFSVNWKKRVEELKSERVGFVD